MTITKADPRMLNLSDAEALKASMGLGQVNNTADADKPISTAVQAALSAVEADALAALAALEGKAATSHTHTIADTTGLQEALNSASPDIVTLYDQTLATAAAFFESPAVLDWDAYTLFEAQWMRLGGSVNGAGASLAARSDASVAVSQALFSQNWSDNNKTDGVMRLLRSPRGASFRYSIYGNSLFWNDSAMIVQSYGTSALSAVGADRIRISMLSGNVMAGIRMIIRGYK